MIKKYGVILSAFLAVLSFVFFVCYFLSFKEIGSMMYWLFPVKLIFIFILIVVYALPIALIFIFSRNKHKKYLKVITLVLMVIGLIINLTIIYILVSNQANLTKPILLIDDEVGVNGLSNLAVILYTPREMILSLDFTNLNKNESVTLYDSAPVRKHIFMIRDLEYNTTYSYSISNYTYVPDIFVTPSSRDSLKIAFSSDFHFDDKNTDTETELNILKYISYNSNFFISGGDLTDWGFVSANLINYINRASSSISKVPSVYIMGNHDSMFGGENYFYRYLTVYKSLGEIKNKKLYGEYCDHYKLNNFTDLITLDLEWGKGENFDKQLKCLDLVLPNISKDDWVIVATHSFFFSSGSKLFNKYWADQDSSFTSLFQSRFVNNGVDFVLSGHNHQLEILDNDGVNYLIAGGSGSKKEEAPQKNGLGSEWISYTEFGFVELNIINESAAVITFRDANGNELYSKTVMNH
jgi:hypothetical protein